MARPVKEKAVIFIRGQLTQGFLLGISVYMVSFNPHTCLTKEIRFPYFKEKAIANESDVSCLRPHGWKKERLKVLGRPQIPGLSDPKVLAGCITDLCSCTACHWSPRSPHVLFPDILPSVDSD